MTFWEHINELFKHLKRIFLSVILISVFIMIIPIDFENFYIDITVNTYPTIVTLLVRILESNFLPKGSELLAINWISSLEVYILISVVMGLILSTPIIAYEIYVFINPALNDDERKLIKPFIFSFLILFIFGVLIGYFIVVPITFNVFAMTATLMNVKQSYDFAQFFYMIGQGLLLCGFFMTTPIYLYIAVRYGFLPIETYNLNRKYIYGCLLIAICLLDPDPGLITETFLGVPLILLLELSIKLAEVHRSKYLKQIIC